MNRNLTPAELERAIIALDREEVRRHGFYRFVQLAWEHVPINANQAFVPAKHIEQMCLHAEAMIPGSRLNPKTSDKYDAPLIQNLVCNIPPGYTKSMIWMVMLNAWIWTFRPEYRFFAVCFDHGLSILNASHCRDLLRSDWYVKRWGNVLDPLKSRQAGFYQTTAGGFRFSTSIGGKGTGRHFHGAFVDDPIKPVSAESVGEETSAQVKAANNWLASVMASRSVDAKTYTKCIIMQRISEDDPAANALAQKQADGSALWWHLAMPAKYEPGQPCDCAFCRAQPAPGRTPIGGDWRTQTDEMLEPVRFPRSAEDGRAAGMGGWDSYVAQAQLQQRPAPPGGLIYKGETFQLFKASDLPIWQTFSCLSVDCNFKKNDVNSDVGVTVSGELNGRLYVYEALSENIGFIETLRLIAKLVGLWNPDAILIEDKANGPAVVEMLRDGFDILKNELTFSLANVIAPDPKTDKVSRAHAANVFYQARSVYHNSEMLGREAFEAMLKNFPKGKKKDTVDANAQALLYLGGQQNGEKLRAFAAMGQMGQQIANGLGFHGGFDTHFRIR